jgi:murein L,D-transpeptidase YafK
MSRRPRALRAFAGPAVLLALACTGCETQTRSPVAGAAVADRIVVEKAAHRMTLFAGGRKLAAYRISLGRGGLAPKVREGDRRTPEGDYRITGRNLRSAYHLSLRIGYPTRAGTAGIVPGGDIMIHGLPNGRGGMAALFRNQDWTDGCIAVTNAEMDEIWRLTRDGAAVRIVP